MVDLEYMTIGDCLDYADEYIALKNGTDSSTDTQTIVSASQTDFDNF